MSVTISCAFLTYSSGKYTGPSFPCLILYIRDKEYWAFPRLGYH